MLEGYAELSLSQVLHRVVKGTMLAQDHKDSYKDVLA